ncbi:MAG: DUF3299 domain-containing protein [Bdellovibrionales bacterium]
MKKSWYWVAGFAAFVAGMLLFFASKSPLNATEIDWRLLGELDYITGHAPAELKSFDQQKIKMPGFMVPLEDNARRVTEFLLVPTPQACIHVPPPPPNQMVHVRVKGSGAPTAFGPIWVYGDFKISTSKSIYGESSFEIQADAIEPYP